MVKWNPPLKDLFELTWHMLRHVKRLKIQYVMPCRCIVLEKLKYHSYPLFIDYLVAKHDYDSNALSWLLLSLLLPSTCTGSDVHPCIQIPQAKTIPFESTISSYIRYFTAIPSKFIMCYL